MKFTESVFRSNRKNDGNPGSGTAGDPKTEQMATSRAEVPAHLPVTEGIFRGLLIPPNALAEPRPAWVEMRNYAHYAPWLLGGSRWIRELGVWYFRLVATPLTAVLRYAEWVIERPARLLIVGTLVWWGLSLIPK